MAPMTILLALASFVGFLLLLLMMLPRSSAQSALLEKVTRDVRAGGEPTEGRSWRSLASTEFMARPFAAIRKLMTPKADPALVRRLMLAGCRQPGSADIFLGSPPSFAYILC